MRNLIAALILAGAGLPAMADEDDIIKVRSTHDVATTMDRLEAAVAEAGANVVARVDHAGAAMQAGMELRPTQLLIYGNPRVGTPAMQDNALAGLYLPLKVLAYEDAEGQVWLAYDDPEEVLEELDGVSDDAEYIKMMTGALANLTAAAVAP